MEVKDFLKSLLCSDSTIVFSDLTSPMDFNTIMKKNGKTNLYFTGCVSKDSFGWNDEQIVRKKYLVVDIDIRKIQIKNGVLLSKDGLLQEIEKIRTEINKNDLTKDWRYIVNSGNGMHIYYTGLEKDPNIEMFKYGCLYFYEKMDDVIGSFGYVCDSKVSNIASLIRLPGTVNLGINKLDPSLENDEAKIYDYQDTDSRIFNELYDLGIAYKNFLSLTKSNKYIPEYEGQDEEKSLYKFIVNTICVADIFSNEKGLLRKGDGRNFRSNRDGSNIGVYYDESDRLLHCNTPDTPHISRPDKSPFDSWTYVKYELQVSEAKDIFRRFKDHYESIKLKDNELKKERKEGKQVADDVWEFQEKITRDWTKNPYTWGIKEFDEKLLRPNKEGELMVLYGHPSMGKTEYTFFVARKNWQLGNKVLFLTLELSKSAMVKRWALASVGLDWNDVDEDNLTDYQKAVVEEYTKKFEEKYNDNMPIVSIKQSPTLDSIVKVIEKLQKQGYSYFIIDNLGKIKQDQWKDETTAFGEISSQLQTLAYKYKIPILLLHHVNKQAIKTRYKNNDEDDDFEDMFKIKPAGDDGFRGSKKIKDNATRMLEIFRIMGTNYSIIFQYKHMYSGRKSLQRMEYNNGEFLIV